MAKFASILNQRFLKREKPKMAVLAEESASGNLTSFSGIFGSVKLSEGEKEGLFTLLQKFTLEGSDAIQEDLSHLIAITGEVRAIHNQAVILHGERIKRAQEILKRYRDGAFSAWLLATYGNRQTPYNFLQYFEFYSQIPKLLHPQLEAMPRQAVYTLASREGSLEDKQRIVEDYQGQTKEQLLAFIRQTFPLEESDGRRENLGYLTAQGLKRLMIMLKRGKKLESPQQKEELLELLDQMRTIINQFLTR